MQKSRFLSINCVKNNTFDSILATTPMHTNTHTHSSLSLKKRERRGICNVYICMQASIAEITEKVCSSPTISSSTRIRLLPTTQKSRHTCVFYAHMHNLAFAEKEVRQYVQ
jgi:hypothetical protein